MHQLGSISLILKSVVKESIAHANHALLGTSIDVVSQLLEPHPIIGIFGLSDAIFEELVDDIDVVNDVQNESFYLNEKKVVSTMFESCIALKLPCKVSFVVLELALLDGILRVFAEVDHF